MPRRFGAPDGVDDGTKESISVVVASNREIASLEACLCSLTDQCAAVHVELIVARPATPDEVRHLRRRFPALRLVDAEPGADIPRLRGLGLQAAAGDLVMLTEDHCVADERWLASLAAAAIGADVVGGGMGNARTNRALDWAAFFAEYGFFGCSQPTRPDNAPLLTGANVAYRRRWIDDVAKWAIEGAWEDVVHERLRARGATLRFERAAKMYQNRSYRFGSFCVDRYQHGRNYARVRMSEHRGTARWVRLLASPLLPAVLLARVARAAARIDLAAFLRALPFTLAFLSAWACGEAVGYWRGPFRISGTS